MQQRTLGKMGFKVGEVGLGCWQFGGDFGLVGVQIACGQVIIAPTCLFREGLAELKAALERRPCRLDYFHGQCLLSLVCVSQSLPLPRGQLL